MSEGIKSMLKKHVLTYKRSDYEENGERKFSIDASLDLPTKQVFEMTLDMNGGGPLLRQERYFSVSDIKDLFKISDTEALLVMMIGDKLGAFSCESE